MSKRLRIFVIHGSHWLTDHHFNGDGLVAWGFINELARRGHEVHVATDHLDVRTETPENLHLMEFPRKYKSSFLHYVSYIRRVRKYYDRLTKTGAIDIVHQMNPVVRGLSFSLAGCDVPIVLGTYVGDWVRLPSSPNYDQPDARRRFILPLKGAIDAVQQHFATSLILASPHALQRIPLTFDVASKIEFVDHGVDTVLFSSLKQPDDPEPLPNSILFVGSFSVSKGIYVLADAFAKVVTDVPDARLVLVGAGLLTNDLRARFEEMKLLDRIVFAGQASRSQVAAWMRSCTILCAPSFGEPYGQNVIEAMACDMPVVITNRGGHRYLSDRAGAVSIEPGNIDQLATALISLLQNPPLRKSMGDHNRRIAEQKHAWPQVTDRLEHVYLRSIAARLERKKTIERRKARKL